MSLHSQLVRLRYFEPKVTGPLPPEGVIRVARVTRDFAPETGDEGRERKSPGRAFVGNPPRNQWAL